LLVRRAVLSGVYRLAEHKEPPQREASNKGDVGRTSNVSVKPPPPKPMPVERPRVMQRRVPSLPTMPWQDDGPLLDRPQPIGFVLVGIIIGWRRDQLRTLFAVVIETTAQLFPGECVLIVGPLGNCRCA
jgi:hypothetical protein